MQLRLLFATPEAEFLKVLDSVIDSALELTPLQVVTTAVAARQTLLQTRRCRIRRHRSAGLVISRPRYA